MRRFLIVILGFVLCAVACNSLNKGPSESLVKSQVAEYLTALRAEGSQPFGQVFRVDSITIKDRLVEGRQASVVTVLTATVIARPFFPGGVVAQADSLTSSSYRFLTSNDTLRTGQVLTRDVTFRFQRFDSGWRLQGMEF
jgi:hypothetical protein